MDIPKQTIQWVQGLCAFSYCQPQGHGGQGETSWAHGPKAPGGLVWHHLPGQVMKIGKPGPEICLRMRTSVHLGVYYIYICIIYIRICTSECVNCLYLSISLSFISNRVFIHPGRSSFAFLPLNHSNFRVSTTTLRKPIDASLSRYYLAACDPDPFWIAENTACKCFLKTSSALHTLPHAYLVWRYMHTCHIVCNICVTMCVHVYMYAYINKCIYIYICIYIHTYIYIYILIWSYMCVFIV